MAEEFGPYLLESVIGQGGMGVVYRAFDRERDRVVALKRLPRHLAEDETFQARFRRESRMAARLNEPHIIPIHDFGEIDGQLYIDMRLVEGQDLSRLIDTAMLTTEVAVDLIGQVAAALGAAHTAGLVHRDVKPSNVIVTGMSIEDPEAAFAYLVDFGIARAMPGAGGTALTSSTGTVGTLGYMAPERISGASGDSRSDIYSLACMLYECLVGHAPFVGEAFQVMYAHVNTAPPSAADGDRPISGALDAVVRRGMAKNPDDRYQTATQFAAAARRALAAAPSGSGNVIPLRGPQPSPVVAPEQYRTDQFRTDPGTGPHTPPPHQAPPLHTGQHTPVPQAPPPVGPPTLPASERPHTPLPPRTPQPQGYYPGPPQQGPPRQGPPPGPPPRRGPVFESGPVPRPPQPSRGGTSGGGRRRTWYLVGAAVVVLAIAGVIVALTAGGGGTPSAGPTTPTTSATHGSPTRSTTGPTSGLPAEWQPYSAFTDIIGDAPDDTSTTFRGATCELAQAPPGITGMVDQVACAALSKNSPVLFYVARFDTARHEQDYLDQLTAANYTRVHWTISNEPRGWLYTSPDSQSPPDLTSTICGMPTYLVQFTADNGSDITASQVNKQYWKVATFPNTTPPVCSN